MSGFAYFPHTEDDIRVMLERIGVRSLDELYSDVPEPFIYKGEYDLPDALSRSVISLSPLEKRIRNSRYS